ncbi:hypothetical protein DLE60_18215 [Micromonospora globispora]|uniref:Uncharacterized protein n=1 Tax=Micromonospora globispora TaxID=1450148 RepID=A0A317KD68_9ACTN|nr:hypothetical protein [Micromonospora globispora]PWU50633.1 hypothetical protein DLJ46_06725 [Micromonospora globispora]PWU59096.1 hypothetical protein DLE60_18215 [Micromonospora globispora]RQX05152.1 hypothetical protein DKL51_02755 [Micromonospora globispora]
MAVLAGAFVEDGADPDGLVAPVVAGLGRSLDVSAQFAAAWRSIVGDRAELPEPVNEQTAFDAAITALTNRRRRLPWRRRPTGLSEYDAFVLAEGWFSSAQWALAATTLLQIAQVRTGFPSRGQLAEAVGRVAPLRPDLQCLDGLLEVLDDEQLVVLHRPSGRGFEVTISGVGDNFQLHTLLAATLSGDPAAGLLEGVAPDPSWVAAATDGPLQSDGGRIRGQFNLVDAYGEWIWNEGRPADIPVLDGRRVVVLDPPPYLWTWNIGRTYPMLHPEVRLDRVLPVDEAAGWLSRVAAPSKMKNRPGHVHIQRGAGDER